MSENNSEEVKIEEFKNEEVKSISYTESIPLINEKYLSLFNELVEKFKYHEELKGSLQHDLKRLNENLAENNDYILDLLTDNLLFCLEQVADHNSDYFIYQKEKVTKKNKVYKNKLPKVGSKTLLKRILKDSDPKFTSFLFKELNEIFLLLTLKDEDSNIVFRPEYVVYVKDNFDENKNFSKMLMVFDNVNNILNAQIIHDDLVEGDNAQETDDWLEDSETGTGKNKKSKKNKKNKAPFGHDFMKGLENTKIAQLAKNISEKINIEDFPVLTDPAKLLSSLGNPSASGDGSPGIQDLLKMVVGEVESAFKNNNINEKDLVDEAQGIMGNFSNLAGFDPMAMFKNGNVDIDQFADIFSKMGK